MKKILLTATLVLIFVVNIAQAEVVAKVGEISIAEADLEARLELLPAQYKNFYSSKEGKKKLVEQLVQEKLIYLHARKNNYEKDNDVLRSLEIAKQNIIISKYISDLLAKIEISNSEIKEYYNQNKQEFIEKEKIHAKHILTKTEKEALAVRQRVVKGESFEDVAKEVSVGPSGKNGGELGWFSKGDMVKPFETAAFALKEKEVSQPVKTQFGYHVIKLYGKKKKATKALAKAKPGIKNKLTEEKNKKEIDQLTENLKKEFSVTIYEDRIK